MSERADPKNLSESSNCRFQTAKCQPYQTQATNHSQEPAPSRRDFGAFDRPDRLQRQQPNISDTWPAICDNHQQKTVIFRIYLVLAQL
jgi:hypothetical protein